MTKLRKYQVRGVQFIQKNNGRAYLADDQGLGKTVQLITWRNWFMGPGRTVIVVPAYLKWNWEEEFAKHDPGTFVQILSKQTVPPGFGKDVPKNAVYIINYQILKFWIKALKALRPRLVVADEAQALGNPSSQQTKAFRMLQQGAEHLVFLSGTPATNKPIELWPALNMLDAKRWGTYKAFGFKWCGPEWTQWGWKFLGSSQEELLHKKLKRHGFIRRKKDDVLKDLPPKNRILIPVELEHPGEYAAAEADFAKWLKTTDKTTKGRSVDRRAKIIKLRMLVGQLKLKAVKQWLDDYLTGPYKILVFCSHVKVVETLHNNYQKISARVDGSVTKDKRKAAFKKIVHDPNCRLLVANMRAAGTGWSATGIPNVCFPEFDWTPGVHDQAEDRARGINRGIEGMPMTAFYLYAKDTVDEMMLRIQEKKRRSLSAIFDGKSNSDSEEDLDLLEQMILARHQTKKR